MVMGGVEKELITILKKFDQSEYEIEVLLFYESDHNITKQIPHGVKLTILDSDRNYWFGNLKKTVMTRLARGHFCEAFLVAGKTAFSGGASSAHIRLDGIEAPMCEYDVAVCYHMHSPVVLRYVAERVSAKRKIAWIHNDFSTTGFQVRAYIKDLKQYDAFAAVSDRLRAEFVSICPEFENKTKTIHNIVDEEEIHKKATEEPDEPFRSDDRIKLVTVGRYVEQKGYDLAISACRLLLDSGYDIAWYAIGWGPDEEKMWRQVKDERLENNFFILGRKENPYPYIAGSDVYVQPSRHEGYAVTICEALALGKKIVATDFAGAREQIEDGVTGFIADSFSPNSIKDKIVSALNHKELVISSTNESDWNKIESVFIGLGVKE